MFDVNQRFGKRCSWHFQGNVGFHQTFDVAVTRKLKLYTGLQPRKPTDKNYYCFLEHTVVSIPVIHKTLPAPTGSAGGHEGWNDEWFPQWRCRRETSPVYFVCSFQKMASSFLLDETHKAIHLLWISRIRIFTSHRVKLIKLLIL
jgi:hypothetical protein